MYPTSSHPTCLLAKLKLDVRKCPEEPSVRGSRPGGGPLLPITLYFNLRLPWGPGKLTRKLADCRGAGLGGPEGCSLWGAVPGSHPKGNMITSFLDFLLKRGIVEMEESGVRVLNRRTTPSLLVGAHTSSSCKKQQLAPGPPPLPPCPGAPFRKHSGWQHWHLPCTGIFGLWTRLGVSYDSLAHGAVRPSSTGGMSNHS